MSDTGPQVLASIDRRLVEVLAPGAIAEAESLAQGFADDGERAAWVAGRLGILLEQALSGSWESAVP